MSNEGRRYVVAWAALVWAVGVAAALWLILPWPWGGLTAALAVLGGWAVFALLLPHKGTVMSRHHGAHTDRAGLATASPAASPAGSMQLHHDRPAWEAHVRDEWEAHVREHPWAGDLWGEIPPGPTAVMVDAGAHEAGPQLGAPWPPYVASGMTNPSPAGPDLSSLTGPAVPNGSGAGEQPSPPSPPLGWQTATTPAPEPPDPDDPGEASMAFDVLNYMRRQDADVRAYLAELADDAATAIRQLREAWA